MRFWGRMRETGRIGLALIVLGLISGALGCKDDDASGPRFVIDASGGSAASEGFSGGVGGLIRIGLFYDGGAAIEIVRDGDVDAGWSPSDVGFDGNFGVVLVVESDRSVALDPVAPPLGEIYALTGSDRLYVSDGDAETQDELPVDTLAVEEGATLTLALNGENEALVFLPGDLLNDGTVTIPDVTAAQRGGINLTVARYFGSGRMLTFGELAGQSGGRIAILVQTGAYASGRLASYGADNAGGDAGDGGTISFFTGVSASADSIEFRGQMLSFGGDSTETGGAGGRAGDIQLGTFRSVRCACTLDARGGTGASGGMGGSVSAVATIWGDVLLQGGTYSGGGDGLAASAGQGAPITIQAGGGRVAIDGSVVAEGGNTSSGLSAGAGGPIAISTQPSNTSADPSAADVPAGDVLIGGSLSAKGGDGGPLGSLAGNGGDIGIGIFNDPTNATQRIVLTGVSAIRSRGGAAVLTAASGGPVDIDVARVTDSTTGTIFIEPTIDTSGGDVLEEPPSSMGGDGGSITLVAPTITTGALVSTGGAGSPPGNDGTITEETGLP